MRLVIYVLVIVAAASCSNKSGVSKKLSGCDSLVINFNAPNTDSIVNTVTTTEKKAISKLAGFLNGKASELYKCGYDGNMIFYKNGRQAMDIAFKYSQEDCRHFVFLLEDKLTGARMSNEAADFLQSLGEGRNWY